VKGEIKMKVYQETNVNGYRFAILLDEETKEAYEAIWDQENESWNTDFSYSALEIDSFDIAGELDFEGVKKLGYKFVE
jgi:hypothetical protein